MLQQAECSYKLQLFCRLSKNKPTGFCFHLFVMIQTCTYLYSSNFTPQVKQAKKQFACFNCEVKLLEYRMNTVANDTYVISSLFFLMNIDGQKIGCYAFDFVYLSHTLSTCATVPNSFAFILPNAFYIWNILHFLKMGDVFKCS